MRFLRELFAGRWPWLYLAATALALLIQLNPAWRDALLYDRHALAQGEWWRLWSGHFVHFGWPHFVADAGLLFILGWLLDARHRLFGAIALVAMPLFISAILYRFDPEMIRYGGLSALNLGLLIYYALQGWQRNWADWFWPAVLVIYVGEVIYEIVKGGRGGGMIAFDDPAIKVATSAHLASAVYALAAWGVVWAVRRYRSKIAAAAEG
ncbi:rhombosortase [Oleiharenicola lentus]|uniref:rhombosortase n=1 Tax=Oleiharenicola lentus TaxID=2508720 RepID=UPI003F670E21